MLLRSGKRKREGFPITRSRSVDHAHTGIKRRRLLPSPSTSCSIEHRALNSHSNSVSARAEERYSTSGIARVILSLLNEDTHVHNLQNPTERTQDTDVEPKRENQSPPNATHTSVGTLRTTKQGDSLDAGACDPVQYWIDTGCWPQALAVMSQEKSESSHKRSRSTSYSQSFKDGDVPRAHSQAYETVLADNGVFMEELKGRSLVGHRSKNLCAKMLRGRYAEPQYTAFPLSQFLTVWQQAQNRNEGRVYRDLTPLLVPSPELLRINGLEELLHVAEDISTEWTRCKTLGGPKPKPDLAIGISATAFDEEEIAKLKNHTAFERPTLFSDHVYFPFLLCEVKCGNEGINRADRQNMHSSSLAVKAVVELFRSLGDDQAVPLSGQVLVFSVSHDNERVKLYGHFPVVENEKTTFYRYPIASFTLNFDENQGWRKTYDFVREVYHAFYPAHVKRIRGILAQMKDPRDKSTRSNMTIEDVGSQDADVSAQSSRENAAFKKPRAPASKKQKGELSLLREQLGFLQQQLEQQRNENQLQMEQQREQKEQQREQMEQQREQMERQRKESREQMEQQREQMEQQREQMERQRKESQEQIKFLQQLLDRR